MNVMRWREFVRFVEGTHPSLLKREPIMREASIKGDLVNMLALRPVWRRPRKQDRG